MATKRYISKRERIDVGDVQYGMNEPCDFDDEAAAGLLAIGAIEVADAAPVAEASAPVSKVTTPEAATTPAPKAAPAKAAKKK